MDYELTEIGADILSDVSTFCERNVLKQAEEADREGIWPEEIYSSAGEMGLGALFVPEEQGGLPLTLQDQAAILETIAAADAGLAIAYMVNYIAYLPVAAYGKEQGLIDLCSEKLLQGQFGAFCLTEDQAGSDVSAIQAQAALDGDEYVLNGSKAFVSNAAVAGFYVVFAKTEAGMTAFLVDGDAEGISCGPEEKKLGIRNSSTREVTFTNVRIPAGNRLGDEGEGKAIALFALDRARALCAVAAVGLAQKALDLAIERANERFQFGQPLAKSNVMQMKLADMHIKIAGAKASCKEALKQIEQGKDCSIASAAAKCLAADAAVYCADEAVQIFGGCGYCEDYPVEKLLRDAKAFQIIEGTGEVLRMNIGRSLVSGK